MNTIDQQTKCPCSNHPGPAPYVQQKLRPIKGKTYHAIYKRVTFAEARKIRTMLLPIATQDSVAKTLQISRQGVNHLELSALYKIIKALRQQRAEILSRLNSHEAIDALSVV